MDKRRPVEREREREEGGREWPHDLRFNMDVYVREDIASRPYRLGRQGIHGNWCRVHGGKKVHGEAEKMNSCASRAHTSNFHFARGSGTSQSMLASSIRRRNSARYVRSKRLDVAPPPRTRLLLHKFSLLFFSRKFPRIENPIRKIFGTLMHISNIFKGLEGFKFGRWNCPLSPRLRI